MSENTRTVRLDHLLGIYAVGSGDWSWQEEYDKLYERDYQHQLTEQIRANGITEPILLGSDGRVWDGHHRICAAMHLGINRIPVVWIATPEPEWEYGTAHADDLQSVDRGYSLEGARRKAMEKHWERVNDECLRQGHKIARAICEAYERGELT